MDSHPIRSDRIRFHQQLFTLRENESEPCMSRCRWLTLFSISCFILSGCSHTISRPLPDDASGAMQLNAGYALLYELMKEEAKVAEILKIKHAESDLADLLTDISSVATDAVTQLKAYAAEDDSLEMTKEYLPAIEASTRSAIKNATTVDLLLPGKARFNELMTISQFSAMRYGRYVATSLHTADSNLVRSKWLHGLAKKLSKLQQRAFELLSVRQTEQPSKTEPPATTDDKS